MNQTLLRRAGRTGLCMLALWPAAASATAYPAIPEPMVFDMMRPLGAERGELEVNALALTALSGADRPVDWAPEIEYAFADGFAIEFELPFVDGRLTDLKLGLQGAFGTLNDGRSAHGVQYLGIYNRETHGYTNTLAYMFGHRFSDRISTMSMIGIGDVQLGKSLGRGTLILNQAVFWNAAEKSILGIEANYRSGPERHLLLMPQLHQKITAKFNVQLGLGIEMARHEPARPKAGLRVIREF